MAASGFSPAFAALLRQGAPPRIDASTQEGAFKALQAHLEETVSYSRTKSGAFKYTWPIPPDLRSSPRRLEILNSIASALIKLGYKQSYSIGLEAGLFSFECSVPGHQCNFGCQKDGSCPVSFDNLNGCHALHLCSATKFS